MTTITIDRAVVEQALEALTNEHSLSAAAMQQRMGAIIALRAALAQEQAEAVEAQKQKLLEAVRIRIMQTAYDCADYGEFESYNGVKVLCADVLEMLK